MAVRTMLQPVEPSRELKFGGATVRCRDEWLGDRSMVLERGVIWLPNLPNLEIIPLADGRQFLCGSSSLAEVGYGGEDEGGPFLRRIDPEALSIFRDEGEVGFWNWLMPDVVASVRNRTGHSARRYGGVYIIDTGLTWSLVELVGSCLGRPSTCQTVVGWPLFRPWAKFNGILIKVDNFLDGALYLAEGGISLPVQRHESCRSLALFKSVHLIACPLALLDLAYE